MDIEDIFGQQTTQEKDKDVNTYSIIINSGFKSCGFSIIDDKKELISPVIPIEILVKDKSSQFKGYYIDKQLFKPYSEGLTFKTEKKKVEYNFIEYFMFFSELLYTEDKLYIIKLAIDRLNKPYEKIKHNTFNILCRFDFPRRAKKLDNIKLDDISCDFKFDRLCISEPYITSFKDEDFCILKVVNCLYASINEKDIKGIFDIDSKIENEQGDSREIPNYTLSLVNFLSYVSGRKQGSISAMSTRTEEYQNFSSIYFYNYNTELIKYFDNIVEKITSKRMDKNDFDTLGKLMLNVVSNSEILSEEGQNENIIHRPAFRRILNDREINTNNFVNGARAFYHDFNFILFPIYKWIGLKENIINIMDISTDYFFNNLKSYAIKGGNIQDKMRLLHIFKYIIKYESLEEYEFEFKPSIGLIRFIIGNELFMKKIFVKDGVLNYMDVSSLKYSENFFFSQGAYMLYFNSFLLNNNLKNCIKVGIITLIHNCLSIVISNFINSLFYLLCKTALKKIPEYFNKLVNKQETEENVNNICKEYYTMLYNILKFIFKFLGRILKYEKELVMADIPNVRELFDKIISYDKGGALVGSKSTLFARDNININSFKDFNQSSIFHRNLDEAKEYINVSNIDKQFRNVVHVYEIDKNNNKRVSGAGISMSIGDYMMFNLLFSKEAGEYNIFRVIREINTKINLIDELKVFIDEAKKIHDDVFKLINLSIDEVKSVNDENKNTFTVFNNLAEVLKNI